MHRLVLPPWIWVAFVCLVSLSALIWGRRSERIGAVIIFGGWLATLASEHHRWREPQWGVTGVDAIVLILLVTLGLRSSRWWPLWAAGFQLLALITHVARLVDRHVGAWAYITAALIWGYALVAALAVGTFNRWRERPQPAANAEPAMAEPGATRR
jgi:hypothetical protein